MPHEHETLDAEPAATTADPPTAAEPDFVARARRIFSGDVRPDDYLPIPTEVVAAVDQDYTPERAAKFWVYRQRTLQDWALSYLYYDTGPVLCRETDHGVIVFAVGLEQIREFITYFPDSNQRPNTTTVTPFPWPMPTPTN